MMTAIEGDNLEGIAGLLLRLRSKGIVDPEFLKTIESVPHSQFVPVQYFDKAWRSDFIPIPCGQTLLPPELTVQLVQALNLNSAHSVLEIGTGSGYQTALLARIAKKVHSVDRYRSLLAAARERMGRLGITNATFEQQDGTGGAREGALYDRIVVDSAYPSMPRELLENLVSGGIVVTAIGAPEEQQMAVRLTKIGSRFEREDLFPVRFGPLQPGVAASL